MKRCASALLVVGLLFAADRAGAQPSATNEAAAEALFLEAEGLMDQARFALACTKYLESQRLDPQLGTLLHLADCYDRNGQTASAWVTFREAAELAGMKGDSREQVAKDRVDALAPRLSYLTIVVPAESQVAGLEIERDGTRVLSATWGSALPIDPGTVRVVARAPGRATWTEEREVTQPGRTEITVPALAALPAAPPPAHAPATAAPAPAPEEKSTSSPLRTTGWVGLGAGGAALAIGGAFALVAGSKGSTADGICPTGKGCTRDEIDRYDAVYSDAESAAAASRVALGVGAVLATAGLVLVLVSPSSSATSGSTRPRVAIARTGWSLSW